LGKILALTLSLLVCTSYGRTGQEDILLTEKFSVGGFQQAVRVVIDMYGTVFILDVDKNEVIIFRNLKERPVSTGGYGWSGGSFDGVNIYVSDYGNHRIQRFDRNMNYITSLRTRDTTVADCRFGYPLDIALSESGDLFILDGENIRVLKFSPIYAFDRKFGDINSGEGRLTKPVRILASGGKLYVADDSRIAIFDYFGNYTGSIGKGKISGVRGFSIEQDKIVIASKDTLWWFSAEGALLNSLPVSLLMVEEKLGQVEDIAVRNGEYYILSSGRLYLFKKLK
jgi:DNA-binding beta-propeller fold protein YncE